MRTGDIVYFKQDYSTPLKERLSNHRGKILGITADNMIYISVIDGLEQFNTYFFYENEVTLAKVNVTEGYYFECPFCRRLAEYHQARHREMTYVTVECIRCGRYYLNYPNKLK